MQTSGGTSPSEQPSNRYGVEVGNYYTPSEHWVFDADFADSRALFNEDDPGDSTFYYCNPTTSSYRLCLNNSNCYGVGLGPDPYRQNQNGSKEVPEAVRYVVAAGATLQDYNGFSAILRLLLRASTVDFRRALYLTLHGAGQPGRHL